MTPYKVGAKLSVVVPDEPSPMSVVVDKDEVAWQHRPGPDDEQPWKSTTGEAQAWATLVVERAPLKIVHVGV